MALEDMANLLLYQGCWAVVGTSLGTDLGHRLGVSCEHFWAFLIAACCNCGRIWLHFAMLSCQYFKIAMWILNFSEVLICNIIFY